MGWTLEFPEPASEWRRDTWASSLLPCPICGASGGTHLDDVTVLAANGDGLQLTASGEDDYSRVTARGVTAPQAPRWRRHGILIHGYCEFGEHPFTLEFRQHKGDTLLMLWGGDLDLVSWRTPGTTFVP